MFRIFLIFISLGSSVFSFESRQKGMWLLGISGGYGFVQPGSFKYDIGTGMTKLPITGGHDINFGFVGSYYFLPESNLRFEIKYHDQQFKFKEQFPSGNDILPFRSRTLALNINARYLFLDILYLGGGFFLDIPMEKMVFSGISTGQLANFLTGFQLDIGADMHVLPYLSVLVGVRFNFPFYFLVNNQNLQSMDFPIDFLFEFGWTF